MPKFPESLAVRTLQLVSIALTVVTLTAIATVAYSGVQEIAYLQTGFQPGQAAFDFVSVDGQLALVLNITVPNRGLYPLELSVSAEFASGNQLISSAGSRTPTIAPRSSGALRFTLPMKLSDFLKNSEFASLLLFESAPFNVTVRGKATVVPFMSLDWQLPFPQRMGPLLGEFRVTSLAPARFNATHVAIPLVLHFVNKTLLPLKGELRITVDRTLLGRLPSPSTVSLPVEVSAGATFDGRVSLIMLQQFFIRGEYSVTFTLSSDGSSVSWLRQVTF